MGAPESEPLPPEKAERLKTLINEKLLYFPASEIYDSAPAGFFDYGPYGEAIRRKVVDFWRKELVQKEGGLEIFGAITMPQDVFRASGHLKSFADPITSCAKCGAVYRIDKLLEDATGQAFPEGLSNDEFDALMEKHNIVCPTCKGPLAKAAKASLMVRVDIGAGENKKVCYLRPEACQSIFLDFFRIHKGIAGKLPLPIAQEGKAFRNEISPRRGTLRSVEFSQMDVEVFFDPDHIDDIERYDEVKDFPLRLFRLEHTEAEEIPVADAVNNKLVSGKLVGYYMARTQQFYENLGIPRGALRFREVAANERAFYAKETWDFEVNTSIAGWLELIADNYRTDHDIKEHMNGCKKDIQARVFDANNQAKAIIPHIWEISIGVDRTVYAVLEWALKDRKNKPLLDLNPWLAPATVAIFPLVEKPEFIEVAKKIQKRFRDNWIDCIYDADTSIGKRYVRVDGIGIPYALTIDGQTLQDNTVTVRERNSGKQIREKIDDLPTSIAAFIQKYTVVFKNLPAETKK